MTGRTCETCAWWRTNRDGWLMGGRSLCEWDNLGVHRAPDACCRHHATSRGWDEAEEREKPATSVQPELLGLQFEVAHLKTRCHEARELLRHPITDDGYWIKRSKEWLEVSDA